jgi:hypothetical protein
MRLTDKQLDELVVLHKRTSKGPWDWTVRDDVDANGDYYCTQLEIFEPHPDDPEFVSGLFLSVCGWDKKSGMCEQCKKDAEFVVAAHGHWLELIEEVRQLRKALGRKEDISSSKE